MPSSTDSHPVFITHKDLASDYYQLLIERGRPKLCRFIWFVLTLFLGATTIFLVYKLVHSYLQFSSYDKISEKWKSTVTLPAITICSTNYLNYTEFEANVESDNKDFLIALLQELDLYDGSGLDASIADDQAFIKLFDDTLTDKTGEVVNMLINYAFQPYQYLLGYGEGHPMYKFAGVWKTLDLDIDYNTSGVFVGKNVAFHKLGNCIELNDDESLKQSIGGFRGGFTIDLSAQVADYLPTTSMKGFVVFLRNADETVLMNKGGIHVPTGTEAFIRLEKSEIKRLEPRYGDCVNETSLYNHKVMKTVRECIQEIESVLTVAYCQCMPYYLNATLEARGLSDVYSMYEELYTAFQSDDDKEAGLDLDVCGFISESLCDIRVLEARTQNATEFKCNEPCNFDAFNWNVNFGHFPPSEKYWETLLKPAIAVEDSLNTWEYAQENFVRINIFYEDIKVTTIEQEKAYEVFNFIAELGGTVDLMIGFSFFTVFQLLELIVVCACYKTYGRREEGGGPPDHHREESPRRGHKESPHHPEEGHHHEEGHHEGHGLWDRVTHAFK